MNRTDTTGDSDDGPVVLQAGDAELGVDPTDGARLTSLRVAGHELLLSSVPRGFPAGSFVMAPWAGRIRGGQARWHGQHRCYPRHDDGHAIHGLVRNRPWRRIGETSWSVTVDGDEWFGPLEIRQHLTLRPDALDLALEVVPLDDRTPAPATVGWHPWFRRDIGGAPAHLDMPTGWMLAREADGITSDRRLPIPPGPWDDAFVGFQGPVVVTWPEVLRLQITSDAPVTVVFTERPDAICVEPQSGPPDEVNHAPPPVSSEQPLRLTSTWSWQQLA